MKETLRDWLGTFWQVLIRPTPQTFLQEAKKADNKFGSAVLWLILYALCIYSLISFLTGNMLGIPALMTVIILIPLAVVLFVSAISFICQRMFRQKKDHYDELLYITIAILLPGFVIIAPIAAFVTADVFKILSFILLVYQVALLVIGVKTILKLEYWQALVTMVLSVIAGIIIGTVIFIAILSTISPTGTTPK